MSSTAQHIDARQAGEIAWSRLAQAANDVLDPMRLVTLANIDLAGRPAARLMVIRGADRRRGHVWLHTDRRSAKATQLRHDRHVSVIAYDPQLHVQLRLIGTATLHERDNIADDHWQQIMMSMRHAYGLPSSPAQPLPPADPRLVSLWQHQRTASIGEDRANFMVIQIAIETIEVLQISGAQQHRMLLTAANDWNAAETQHPSPSAHAEITL